MCGAKFTFGSKKIILSGEKSYLTFQSKINHQLNPTLRFHPVLESRINFDEEPQNKKNGINTGHAYFHAYDIQIILDIELTKVNLLSFHSEKTHIRFFPTINSLNAAEVLLADFHIWVEENKLKYLQSYIDVKNICWKDTSHYFGTLEKTRQYNCKKITNRRPGLFILGSSIFHTISLDHPTYLITRTAKESIREIKKFLSTGDTKRLNS
jgi:hypothetical protein